MQSILARALTLHGLQQSRRHVLVVNELDETETDVLRVPFLIRTMVDNADDTPHRISVLVVSDERLDVRKVQPGIFTGANVSRISVSISGT